MNYVTEQVAITHAAVGHPIAYQILCVTSELQKTQPGPQAGEGQRSYQKLDLTSEMLIVSAGTQITGNAALPRTASSATSPQVFRILNEAHQTHWNTFFWP